MFTSGQIRSDLSSPSRSSPSCRAGLSSCDSRADSCSCAVSLTCLSLTEPARGSLLDFRPPTPRSEGGLFFPFVLAAGGVRTEKDARLLPAREVERADRAAAAGVAVSLLYCLAATPPAPPAPVPFRKNGDFARVAPTLVFRPPFAGSFLWRKGVFAAGLRFGVPSMIALAFSATKRWRALESSCGCGSASGSGSGSGSGRG